MNSENSRTPKSHILILKLTYKLDLIKSYKKLLLHQISVFITHEKT